MEQLVTRGSQRDGIKTSTFSGGGGGCIHVSLEQLRHFFKRFVFGKRVSCMQLVVSVVLSVFAAAGRARSGENDQYVSARRPFRTANDRTIPGIDKG